jgi:hypothetical protein
MMTLFSYLRKDRLESGPVFVYKTEGRPRIDLSSYLLKDSLESGPFLIYKKEGLAKDGLIFLAVQG